MELAALKHLVINQESETLSEQNERQAREADYIGSPDTIQGQKDNKEDESSSKEDSNEEDKEESKISQAAEVKGTKPNGGGLDGRGVDG